jgi:hypothetical protein
MAIEVSRPARVTGGPSHSRVIGSGGTAYWLSAGAALWQANVAVFGALFSACTPVRGISVYMWTVVALSTAAWLARIVPGVARGGAPGYLRGTGLVAWIAVQLLILRRYFFLQPVIAGIGAAEVLVAWRWQRSGRMVTGPRDQRP